MQTALACLCKWLKEAETERESKNKQKLLRNLMVCTEIPIKFIVAIKRYCYRCLSN